MKKWLGFLVSAAMLVAPPLAGAADQIGIYVAPKFVYGLAQMDGTKELATDDTGSGTLRIGSDTGSTFGGSIAFGYDFEKKFNVPIRAEVEYAAFSQAENKRNVTVIDGNQTAYYTSKQTFNIQTLFLNAYWDIPTGTDFAPYVGAGLGAGFITTKGIGSGTLWNNGTFNRSWSDSTGYKTVTNFAWNVGAGLGYELTDYATVDLGYRFVGLGSVKTKTGRDSDGDEWDSGDSISHKTDNLYQHQVALGMRFTF
jgi:opacity protein-like surface antigen